MKTYPNQKIITIRRQTNMETNKTKKIFSRKMAVFLRRHGCKIVGTEINPYKPEFDVWVFEDGKKLQAEIANYMNEIN